MSQYAHLSTPDPEWVQISTKLPAEPDVLPPIEERRRVMAQLVVGQHELWDPPYPKSGFKVTEVSIPVEEGSIAVRTYIPEVKAGEIRFPLLVWFHGGGFSVGGLEMDDTLLRLICVKQRISCVNVDYRLAPEYPFPIPVNDSYIAMQWAAANADSLSADLTKGFIIGGCSAGGNLATVVALKARDDPSFKAKLTGQILQMPFLCPSVSYPEKWKSELLSAEQNKDAPIVNTKSLQLMLATYAPDLTAPEFAPLLASSHTNLPATYLQICGLDPLRDEAFLYEKILRESGVPTKHDVYPGQPHVFYEVGPNMTQSKKWREDVQKGLEWLLQLK